VTFANGFDYLQVGWFRLGWPSGIHGLIGGRGAVTRKKKKKKKRKSISQHRQKNS
jgi:hypothetical protein